jgi:cell division protein FtsW
MPKTATDISDSGAIPSSSIRGSVLGRGVALELQLWVVVLLLMTIGVVMIYSASTAIALKKFSDPAYFIKRHLLYFFIGLTVMTVASCVPYRWFRTWWVLLMAMTLSVLIAVLIPGVGKEVNNAQRWIQIGSFSLQPAEFAKVVWVIYLAVYLSKKEESIRQFAVGFLPPMILCGVFCFLILLESDFGTPFMISLITVSMLALGGVPWRYLLALTAPALAVFYWFVYSVPYRWERITAFRNPWTDPLDSGYQLIQAWIAVGTGGVLGKGLGAGQQKLFFLPEPYTDFIFAVIGEEMGFLGVFAVVMLFALLLWTGFRIALHAPDFLGSILAIGLTMLFSFQALINMGVVLGLFPTKGLPLPFISYGGSSFTANSLAAGILLNIARNSLKR